MVIKTLIKLFLLYMLGSAVLSIAGLALLLMSCLNILFKQLEFDVLHKTENF